VFTPANKAIAIIISPSQIITNDLRQNENTLFFSKSKIKDDVVTKLNSVKVLNFDNFGAFKVFINENKHFICFRVATSHKNALRLLVLSILNNYNTTC
jgi:hypothetical protein